MVWKAGVAIALSVALLAGCARPPAERLELSAYAPTTQQQTPLSAAESVAAAPATVRTPIFRTPAPAPLWQAPKGKLAGRVLVADNQTDLILRPGEVILTFDDGPRPGRTDVILEVLEEFGVSAVFLMLGQMVDAHPELARDVARAGHTIGSHTYGHANLSLLPPHMAMAEIWHGHEAVAAALAPLRQEPSRFFRFPYLAQSQLLRTNVISGNLIVLDVDVDSNDYFRETPEQVLARTLARLEARGQGIILFHDIHARTVAMLPAFLAALEERGYEVVTLRSRGTDVFDTEVIAAVDQG